jgi:hypothetical protein
MIQSVWYEGFYNMQGRHQAFVADTDGATGRIDDLVLLAHGNSLSGSNVITKINGTAYHWHIEGQHDPPDANGDTAFQFANLSNSFVRFVTNAKNCFTAPDASHSIISVDRSCTPFAPNALLVSAASTSIPSLATLTFSHAGSTTLSPQSANGAFTVTVPAATGQFAVTANPAVSTVAPTISSGFGTSPRIALQNGTAAFEIVVGSNPATTGVIALPAATNGWACQAEDMSNLGVTTRETAFTATSVSFSAAPSWGAGDQLLVTCTAF